MTRIRNERYGVRLATLFSATGALMWAAAVLFIGQAFGMNPGPGDWVQMHLAKLEVGVGVGLAGIGSLFICFAALLSMLARSRTDL
jgi:membrane protein DedA with SNARE-associated domain